MKSFSDYGISVEASSGNVRAVCPWCEPTRKHKGGRDLSVNVDKGVWQCHHCGVSGGLGQDDKLMGWQWPTIRKERVIMDEGGNYEMEITEEDDDTGSTEIQVDDPVEHEGQGKAFIKPNLLPITEAGLAYLKSRGISEDTATMGCIKSARMYSRKIGKEAECIAFPVIKNGEIVNVKYRFIDEKDFSQTKNGDQTALFNGDSLKGSNIIVFTEGEMDALSIMEAGYPAVVSCPNGAPPIGAKSLDAKLTFIEANRAAFDAADRIILAMDKDEPGMAFEKIMINKLGAVKCWQVIYPDGCKDANDCLTKFGKAELVNRLDKVRPVPVEGIITFRDKLRDIVEYYHNQGKKNLYSTGIKSVDEVFKLQLGTLNILTGIPSHGKSEWMDQIIINTAKLHKWRWGIFSPENYPVENHFQKLAEKWIAKPLFPPSANASWSIPTMTQDEVVKAISELSEFLRILTITETGNGIDGILSRIEVCAIRDKIRAFVLDPWNEIEHSRPSKMTETEYISSVLSRLRNFSRLHGLACFIVAHPTKLQKNLKGEYPIPTPYDISGSSHFRNKADNCFCIWRDQKVNNGEVELHIQKVRNKNAGSAPQTIKLQWTRANGIISDIRKYT